MPTRTEICNLALARLGVDIQIADIDSEDSKEAKVCRLHYDTALDKVLEDFPWNFATRQESLAEVAAVDPPAGWQLLYQYPTDALTIRALLPEGGDRLSFASRDYSSERLFYQYLSNAPRVPYKVFANDNLDGRWIASDEPNAVALYTVRIETTTAWPGGFVHAFKLWLAHEVCMPMRVDDKRRSEILQEYQAMKDMAAANSLNEQGYDPDPLPTSYTARL